MRMEDTDVEQRVEYLQAGMPPEPGTITRVNRDSTTVFVRYDASPGVPKATRVQDLRQIEEVDDFI